MTSCRRRSSSRWISPTSRFWSTTLSRQGRTTATRRLRSDVLQALSICFAMLSAFAATATTRDMRRARDAQWRDRWRQERHRRLDALTDAVVGVGEAAIRARELPGDGAGVAVAQMRLRRAVI